MYNPTQSILFTYDNFHLTFPNQLQAKLQQEFGSHQINSLGHAGNQHRKKITSGKKGPRTNGGGFGVGGGGVDDLNKKVIVIFWVLQVDLLLCPIINIS